MTRKDFELIAVLISEISTHHQHRAQIAVDFSNTLQLEYKNFDREKFLVACTPNWVVGSLYEKYYDRLV